MISINYAVSPHDETIRFGKVSLLHQREYHAIAYRFDDVTIIGMTRECEEFE
jgi:hypothetical protein